MIELDHVSRIYVMGEQELHALDDVSEEIRSGEYPDTMWKAARETQYHGPRRRWG